MQEFISYDSLKAEFVKKQLHGYIASSSYLVTNTARTAATPAARDNRMVSSKILGKFVNKTSSKQQQHKATNTMDTTDKVYQMMAKAVKIQ